MAEIQSDEGAFGRVSFETSFDSKHRNWNRKPISALSETKRLFRLFRFYSETASFGVLIEPKQTEDQQKQTKTRKQKKKKYINRLKCCPLPPIFPIHTRPVITNREISLYRVKRGFPAAAKLLLLFLLFIRAKGAPTCLNVLVLYIG
jgi:hypothetical protein